MKLEPGRDLLHYQLVEKIGEGGMGVVWKARDTTLDREVAVKLIPESLACTPERLARFEREARVVASLSHPSIASIFSLHECEGRRFIAMELVPGEDLSARIDRGPIPPEEALRIALHVAEALETAHESGIVHRDLKPANIRLMPDGRAKVLDFGLAKALMPDVPDSDSSLSPTMTSAGTAAGVLMGTAGYMSPEQARGEAVDRRADIWAFGCVLYEMLTGQRAFPGKTATDAIAAIIERTADWDSLPAGTPRRIVELMRRCLKKNAQVRLRDIGEARIVLREVLERGATGDEADEAAPPVAAGTRRLPWMLAGVFAVLAAVAFLLPRAIDGLPGPLHLGIALPAGDVLTGGLENGILAVSPDGRSLVYAALHDGQIQLFLRHLDDREVVPLAGTEGAMNPFFSPDGEWIAFFARGNVWKVSVHGGAPSALCDECDLGTNRGGTWPRDDTIVLSPEFVGGLLAVPVSGGEPAPLTELDESRSERTHRWPLALPGGEWVVFTVGDVENPSAYDDARIEAVSLETRERRVLVEGGSQARYAPTGHLVYARHGGLIAGRLDPSDPRPPAETLPVLQGVAGEASSGVVHFDIAEDGTLIYMSGGPGTADRELVWVDRRGNRELLPAPPMAYQRPLLSPDGSSVMVTIVRTDGDAETWVYDLEREVLNRVGQGKSGPHHWLADGASFLHGAGDGGERMLVETIDGSAPPREVYRLSRTFVPSGLSPDGRSVIFTEFGDADSDVASVTLDGSGELEILVDDASGCRTGVASPDGRWLAYVSNRSGTDETYVQPYGGQGGQWQVSPDGGRAPLWSRDGTELFFLRDRTLMRSAVDVDAAVFKAGSPEPLFDLPPTPDVFANRPYDVAVDGTRFLTTWIRDPEYQRIRVDVVLGWAQTLEERLP